MVGLIAAREEVMLASTREHPIIEGLKTGKEAGQDGLPEWKGKRPAVAALVAVVMQQHAKEGTAGNVLHDRRQL